jgi:AraC-like DNA-binding protein
MDFDTPTVTSRMLNKLPEFMESRGMNYVELAERSGLDPAVTTNPALFVSFIAVLKLFELAARLSRDDAFGLRFAQAFPLAPIGLYHFMQLNAATVRQALELRVCHTNLVQSAYDLELNTTRAGAFYTWKMSPSLGPRRQFLSYAAMLVVERVRIMLRDRNWKPAAVEFEFPEPRQVDAYRRALGCKVTFNAAQTRIRFDRATLERTLPSADHILCRELQDAANLLPSAPSMTQSIRHSVIREIVKTAGTQNVTQRSIAKALGMSVRSLQRELADIGTTFSALVEASRRDMALTMLTETQLPISEIAYRLGFAQTSSFSRAARSWFGEPARELRKVSC